jgi:hypothetical protein
MAVACILAACSADQTRDTKAPAPAPQVSAKDKLDIYEAVIRYRLGRAPLRRGRKLYVHVNFGAPPGLARRFPEYDAIIRSGSQGNSPPRHRYYFLDLGRVTADKAFVYVEAAVESGRILELRRRGEQWVVVDDHEFILT